MLASIWAWSRSRGKPCSTQPLCRQSGWLRRCFSTFMTMLSGTVRRGGHVSAPLPSVSFPSWSTDPARDDGFVGSHWGYQAEAVDPCVHVRETQVLKVGNAWVPFILTLRRCLPGGRVVPSDTSSTLHHAVPSDSCNPKTIDMGPLGHSKRALWISALVLSPTTHPNPPSRPHLRSWGVPSYPYPHGPQGCSFHRRTGCLTGSFRVPPMRSRWCPPPIAFCYFGPTWPSTAPQSP